MLEITQFEEILRVLTDGNVRFVLIGGVAMRLHGAAHLTDDIDICYDRHPANLANLAAALAPYHVKLRGAPPDLPFIFDTRTLKAGLNFTFVTDLGSIDILGEVPGVSSFETLWGRSTIVDLPGLQVRVAAIEDLILMKRAANRAKDQTHLLELQRLLVLINVQAVDPTGSGEAPP